MRLGTGTLGRCTKSESSHCFNARQFPVPTGADSGSCRSVSNDRVMSSDFTADDMSHHVLGIGESSRSLPPLKKSSPAEAWGFRAEVLREGGFVAFRLRVFIELQRRQSNL